MILTDLYTKLAIGELNNLSLAEGGAIAADKRSTIVLHANEGLKRLYTKFLLKEDTLFLEQVGFLTSYSLSSKYAQSKRTSSATHSFYINDLGSPFQDDIIKVLNVWDGYGRKLPLNEQHMWRSVFTPQPTLLQIPHPVDGAPLSIQYQAAHPTLYAEKPDQEIILPEFLMEALTGFVAYKVLSHINTQESTAKAREHKDKFESICIEVVDQGLVTTGETTSGIRFENNGWR